MNELLSPTGYSQSLAKLDWLRDRLAALETRQDLGLLHKQEARRSYQSMIRQIMGEVALYEASHPDSIAEISRARSEVRRP